MGGRGATGLTYRHTILRSELVLVGSFSGAVRTNFKTETATSL